MPDLLKVAANSLQGWQQALNTTGHNIANANTEGFSRQTVNFATLEARSYGYGFVGQGAKIANIERSHNAFLTSQVQNFASSTSRYETFTEFSSRIDDILSSSENNLNTSLQRFFNAAGDVAANPAGLPERQVMLGEAANLVDRQQSYSRLLSGLNADVNSRLRFAVTEVNSLADSIGAINKQITSAISSSNGATPNDLLDQRDRLVEKLSQKIGVTTVEQGDGSLNVLVGTGQALVVGSQISHLDTRFNATDSTRLEVVVPGQLGNNETSAFVSGGELQGLLDFRSRVLNPTQDQLGLIALGLSNSLNAQHQLGVDLNGAMGGAFFTTGSINVAGNTMNAGTAAPVATLTDATQLRASSYGLNYDGAQWTLTRRSDNTSVSGAGPLLLDGLSIDVSSGVPTTGDSFVINPARAAGANFALAITDPTRIAAAAPVAVNTPLGNTGTGTLDNVVIAQTNTLPLAGPITLTFNPNALGAGVPGFDVVGGPGGTIAYDPATESAGKTFSFVGVGLSFTVADIPQTGDTFTLSNNTTAIGDNRNMLHIGDLQFSKNLNGSASTLQEFYGSMVAQVGVINNQANANLSIETSLMQQAVSYKDSVSGVNLDEEAANLLRYQQAYQASAQMVKIADEMFQTLLNSIR